MSGMNSSLSDCGYTKFAHIERGKEVILLAQLRVGNLPTSKAGSIFDSADLFFPNTGSSVKTHDLHWI
ncbi:hypothetical protein [Pelagibacterium mangrovi]|uniref:hypothetical protein n=1 Tax=Pelagibacterium mangrovi TaxID=3119828 RepID=UPI002FCB5E91